MYKGRVLKDGMIGLFTKIKKGRKIVAGSPKISRKNGKYYSKLRFRIERVTNCLEIFKFSVEILSWDSKSAKSKWQTQNDYFLLYWASPTGGKKVLKFFSLEINWNLNIYSIQIKIKDVVTL